MPKIDVNVSENVTDLVDKPIHNLVDKPAASIGDGIAGIFNLVFATVEYLGQSAQLAYQYQIEKKNSATRRTLRRTNKNSKTR